MTSDRHEIRCPNCSRLTLLAPFCTHCGAVIPEGAAAARPRAMDRGELEARIRQRQGAESPYLRGEQAADASVPGAAAWHSSSGPAAFVPEPSDELARHEAEHTDEGQRVDYLDERRTAGGGAADPVSGVGGIPGAAYSAAAADWPSAEREPAATPELEPAEAAPPPAAAFEAPAHQPTDFGTGSAYRSEEPIEEEGDLSPERPSTPDRGTADYVAAASAAGYGAAAGGAYATRGDYDEPRYPGDGGGHDGDGGDGDGGDWTPYGEEPPRRSSAALTIIGFVVLGIAALVGGAILFSVLNVPAGVASQSSTPTPTEQASASPTETAGETATPSTGETPGASPSAGPDNFSAKVQPCATDAMDFKGCDVDGSTLDRGKVWVWVKFLNGRPDDSLGVQVLDKSSGAGIADASSVQFGDLAGGCQGTCSGYINIGFDNLDPGDYTIKVTRDGDEVATADFTVKE